MKTADNKIQILLEQTCALYNSEREITALFEALEVNTNETHLREGIVREAEENKRQCARLEGLLSLLQQNTINSWNTGKQENFVKQFSTTLKRVIFKHSDFGYKTAIFAATALGQNEIANLFKCALSSNTMIVK